jgi:adenylosuccinate lyase
LIERIQKDPAFSLDEEDLKDVLNPSNYIGIADRQVEEFLAKYITPVIQQSSNEEIEVELNV